MHLKTTTPEAYRQAQLDLFNRKRDAVWLRQAEVPLLADLIKTVNPQMGLCHGVRTGFECVALADALGCEVTGTEIGMVDHPLVRPNFDFHGDDPAYRNRFDFVYTNAFDHSDKPRKALKVWSGQLRSGGMLVLHWSRQHMRADNFADCFGASVEDYQFLLREVCVDVGAVPTLFNRILVWGTL